MLERNNGLSRSGARSLASAEDESLAIPALQPAEPARAGLLKVLWERRWTVLGLTVVSLAIGFIYVYRATKLYTSSSRIYVEPVGPKILNEQQAQGTSTNYLYTQCELIQSSPILATALESPTVAALRKRHDITNPVGYLKSGLDASIGKNDDIITVSFQSTDPEEASQVVNSVVDAYVTYQSKQKRSTAAEVLKILQKEKDKRDLELTGYLKQMLAFKQANAALSFRTTEGNIITQRLAAVASALTTTQLEVIEARAALEGAKGVKDNPDALRQLMPPEFLDATMRNTDSHVQLQQTEFALASLRDSGLGIDNVSVKRLTAQAARLRSQLDEEFAANQQRFIDAYFIRLEQNLSKAQYREQELKKAFTEQQKDALSLNVKEAEYAMLESDLHRTERLCEILDNRIKELNVTEDVGALNISILEVGQASRSPIWPDKSRVMLIALFAGLAAGAGAAMLQDLVDQRLRSADDIQATLGLPVLGIVRHMLDASTPSERGKLVHMEPMSGVAEAYRTIRTAIYFGVPEGQAKRMLLTSPAQGDGKSTTVSNLAIAMAMAGQTTLIIDADFRRPTQHKIFGLKDEVGLSSVIVRKAELQNAIQTTDVRGLSVLPCGPVPPNPSELLSSQRFADLLDELSKQYDQIIIDSPPVMAVADARILGASCDLTVLVVRAGRSTRKASLHAVESLLGVGSSVLGVVVNDVPKGREKYGYYSPYGYYGYYGQDGRNRNGKGANAIEHLDDAEHSADRKLTVARK